MQYAIINIFIGDSYLIEVGTYNNLIVFKFN